MLDVNVSPGGRLLRRTVRNNKMSRLAEVHEVLEPDGTTLKGKSFSITGHLGKPRPQIISLIQAGGGEFHKEPSWDTHFLISNQDWSKGTVKGGSSKKLDKAVRNGTKIITEEEFFRMLAGRAET